MISLSDLLDGRRARRGCLVVAALAWASGATALYVTPDLKRVPLARLIGPLEEKLKVVSDADRLETLHHLARLHGMAYAWRVTDRGRVAVMQTDGQVFFGFEPPHVPYRDGRPDWPLRSAPAGNGKPEPQATAAVAATHLDRAIELYRRALDLARAGARQDGLGPAGPKTDALQLGLAWCLNQKQPNAEAGALLRSVVDSASRRELRREALGLGPLLAVEAIDDLLAMLRLGQLAPSSDSEVSSLEDLRTRLEQMSRAITPLVVDLGGGGDAPAALIDDTAQVVFDLDGTGLPRPWQWVTPRAAWLVWDPERSGDVRDALQLFGSRTFNLFPADGFAALALLDADGNGWLRGGELEGLALWHDANGDGRSDRAEVTPLDLAGFVALKVGAERDQSGLLVARGGALRDDGRGADIWDIVLEPTSVLTTRNDVPKALQPATQGQSASGVRGEASGVRRPASDISH